MAEAVLNGVLGSLTSLAATELGSFLGFSREKEKLESMFTAIKAALEDAEEKQFSDKATKDWMGKLKDAAYELDDILDECVYEQLRLEQEEEGEVRCSISEMVLSSSLSSFHPTNMYFRYKIAKRMKIVSERLDRIASEKDQLRLTSTVQEETRGVPEWRQTFSLVTEPEVYGREKDIKKIVDFLAGDASRADEDLSVYPITGLGGLGKTTLSQLIFNHERVINHFEPRVWICVSEDFGLKRMIKGIIEGVTRHACEDLDLDPLQRKLQDLLQNKRYLLVLDDVWNDKQESWERLKSVLGCGALGASILVTTRLTKVAAIMGTMPPYELSELSDNDCWRLFKHRAFVPNEVEQEELVVVGKEIVKKCGGVPLAAKVLGGLLRFKREVREWLKVKESNIWGLTHDIMPALRLSYLNLPINLRQCFAYCAIFPKDEPIKKQYLIDLWMANGFISSDGKLDAEDVGDGVWNELYWRSFFQDITKDEFGKVKWFKMHDLVHDLAQSVAEEVCCITNDDDASALFERKRIHHLSDYWAGVQFQQVKSLRTCIGTNVRLSPGVWKCYSLRLLHGLHIELSSAIGDLKHLRYLNLSFGFIKTLPESLGKLLNLQILKLDYCSGLQKLPDSLVRLKSLQQLSLKGCRSLSLLAPHIGKLSSLRSLSMYIVGEERGFHLAELGPLKLKRDLDIKHLERVKRVNDAKVANMSRKQLKKLTLTWERSGEGEVEGNDEEVLEGLQPCCETLESLRVEGYEGVRFPQWMSSPSLKNLKRVEIIGAKYVTYVKEECCDDGVAFMALEYLSLRNLPNLIRLSSEDGENQFPCLSRLEIECCPKFSLQGLQSLKKLEMRMCPKLKVWAGLQCLSCLEDLMIESCLEVEGLQHMTALKKLRLGYVSNIESVLQEVRFGELHLLRQLSIVGCHKLMCLPTSLSLSSLEELYIWGCNPELEKRCKRESGEDWPIIAHIPYLHVS